MKSINDGGWIYQSVLIVDLGVVKEFYTFNLSFFLLNEIGLDNNQTKDVYFSQQHNIQIYAPFSFFKCEKLFQQKFEVDGEIPKDFSVTSNLIYL